MESPTTPADRAGQYRKHINNVRTVRWVIAGVAVAVGAALLINGNIVAGALIGGFAVFRVAMLLYLGHQRKTLRAGGRGGDSAGGGAGAMRGRRFGAQGGARAGFPRLAQRELDVAAATIGMDADELRQAVGRGESIAGLARQRAVAPSHVVEAVVADASAMLDVAAPRGRLSTARLGQAKAQLPQWADGLVNATAPPAQ